MLLPSLLTPADQRQVHPLLIRRGDAGQPAEAGPSLMTDRKMNSRSGRTVICAGGRSSRSDAGKSCSGRSARGRPATRVVSVTSWK